MFKILAYAKLNLYLKIIDRLPDGYHTLSTVMQTVSLCDELQISRNNKKSITFICDNKMLESRDNLIIKAANLFFEATDITDGLDIKLTKRIPVAAGLGGGSSDAAATLSALNHIYGSPLEIHQLEKIGFSLGADVPFFIRGGCSLAEGIGEKLSPLEKTNNYYYVVVKSGIKSSTRDMYNAIDKMQKNKNAQHIDFVRLVNDRDYLLENSCNDFMMVSCPAEQLLADFSKAGASRVLLSGSGPTCFSVFDNYATARSVFDKLSLKYKECFIAEDKVSGSSIV